MTLLFWRHCATRRASQIDSVLAGGRADSSPGIACGDALDVRMFAVATPLPPRRSHYPTARRSVRTHGANLNNARVDGLCLSAVLGGRVDAARAASYAAPAVLRLALLL